MNVGGIRVDMSHYRPANRCVRIQMGVIFVDVGAGFRSSKIGEAAKVCEGYFCYDNLEVDQ